MKTITIFFFFQKTFRLSNQNVPHTFGFGYVSKAKLYANRQIQTDFKMKEVQLRDYGLYN